MKQTIYKRIVHDEITLIYRWHKSMLQKKYIIYLWSVSMIGEFYSQTNGKNGF